MCSLTRIALAGLCSAALLSTIAASAQAAGPKLQRGVLKLQRTNLQPGFKRFSTGIMGVGEIVAMERQRNYDNAKWVASSATPNAQAGGWTKGNLGSFPNLPSPSKSEAAAPAPAAAKPATETPEQTTTRLNQIMQEMQRAGYASLQIVGSGPNSAVRGLKESAGVRTESTVCKPGMVCNP